MKQTGFIISLAMLALKVATFPLLAEEVKAAATDPVVVEVDNVPDTNKLPIHAWLDIDGRYDDNIFISHTNKKSDFIWSLSPGVSYESSEPDLNKRNYVLLSYSPTFQLFTDHSSEDAIDQDALLRYRYMDDKVTFTLSQTYKQLTDSLIETGGRVRWDEYGTDVVLSYLLMEKNHLELDLNQKVVDYHTPGYLDYNQWQAGLFWLYDVSPVLTVGFGPNFGWVDVDQAPNHNFEQILARLNYQPTEKISVALRGGVEFRQYEGPNANELVLPVASMDASYQPFDGTKLTLGVYREVHPSSVIGNEVYVDTGVRAAIHQRFCQSMDLGLTGGYDNSDYSSTQSTASANRADDYYFIRPSLDVLVAKWWKIGCYYEFRKNDSNIAAFSFDNNQAGIQTSFNY